MSIGGINFDAVGRPQGPLGLRTRNAQSSEEEDASRGLLVDAESDILEISPEGLAAAAQSVEDEEPRRAVAPGQEDLAEEELEKVEELEERDEEVRRHEQAHIAAGGRYVRGGASLEYTTGPDGQRYATGGEVSIDIGAERTPQATIQKMETVQRAAMAPAQPSAQDRAVYRAAVAREAEARRELAKQSRAEAGSESGAASAAGQTEGIRLNPAGASGESSIIESASGTSTSSPLAPAEDDTSRATQGPPVRRLDVSV